MAAALLARLVWDNRTSFGDPVLPEVDISSARSSCRSVRAGRADGMPAASITVSGE